MRGLVAVVIGAGGLVGEACVRALVQAGARVGVLDPEPPPRIDPATLPRQADVLDQASMEAALAAVAAEFGGIDTLVNCADRAAVGRVEENDDAEWQRVFDVNVLGVVRACRVALPYLRRSRYGSVVNISSVAAISPVPNRALLSASKGAVHSLTLAMAADLAPSGVRVNCVSVGTVDSGITVRPKESDDAPVSPGLPPFGRPPGRTVTPEEVATAVCYLASPGAGATTGAALVVDGAVYTADPRFDF